MGAVHMTGAKASVVIASGCMWLLSVARSQIPPFDSRSYAQ